MSELTVGMEIEKGHNNMPTFAFYSNEVERMKVEFAEEAIREQINILQETFVCLEQV